MRLSTTLVKLSGTIHDVSNVAMAPPSNSTIAWIVSQHVDAAALEHAARALGVDLHRLALEQPADQVHRVREEEPFGAGLPAPGEHRRRHVDRVAEAGVRHHRSAEIAALDVRLRAHVQRVPARVEVDHQRSSGTIGRVHHRLRLGDRRRERLLDQHVLARGEQREHGSGMQMVGRRHRHGIDVARRDVIDARRPGAAALLGEGLRALRILIADHGERAAGMILQRHRVVAAPQPGPHDSDSHRHPLSLRRARRGAPREARSLSEGHGSMGTGRARRARPYAFVAVGNRVDVVARDQVDVDANGRWSDEPCDRAEASS